MKTLKFRESLVEPVLRKEKFTTWRLFDDKDLSVGDVLSFLVWERGEEFARAQVVSVNETVFGALTDDDWDGHEEFSSDEEMYRWYGSCYARRVDATTPVKVLRFELQEH